MSIDIFLFIFLFMVTFIVGMKFMQLHNRCVHVHLQPFPS